MPVSPFIHNDTFFRDIRDRNGTMNASDFDFLFTKTANFINNEIIPVLNQLLGDAVPGSTAPNDINKFRRNIGDGTTDWASIGEDAIPDFSLEFSKLSKCTPCSILAAGIDRQFREVTSTRANETLISRADNAPIWDKIRAENILDRQVTAEKIALATLVNENFEDGLLATQLLDNAVTDIAVEDQTITSPKIADGAMDADILGADLFKKIISNNGYVQLHGNTLPDEIIESRNQLAVNHLNYTFFDPDTIIPLVKFESLSVDGRWFANGAILNYNIVDNSLDGMRLNERFGNSQYRLPRDINDLIEDGGITPANLPAQYRQALGL